MSAAPGVRITGAIVAGGASSRFGGRAKGLLRVGGRRIIDRIADALRPVVDSIAIISNAPDADTWLTGAPVWRDQRGERASIVGIHTALLNADNVFVVAWDMPFVTEPLVHAVARRLNAEASAVVPYGPQGPEPLCAIYTRDCLPAVEDALAAQDLRMTSLVGRLPRLATMPLAEIATLGDPERLFFNVNSTEDLRVAEAMASR